MQHHDPDDLFRSNPTPSEPPPYTSSAYNHTLYGSLPELKEYTYNLANKKGEPWLSLRFSGRCDTSNLKQEAVFLEGDDLEGSVTLILNSAEPVHSVAISAIGHIITGATPSDDYVFLEAGKTLWSRTMGDPNHPVEGSTEVYHRKLSGTFSWPFSLSLSSVVTHPGAFGQQELHYSLPQTFYERHTRPKVNYELVVKVVRHKLFHGDKKLQAPFTYIPISQPNPPSTLRQWAYREDRPVPGLKTDPDGWKTLPSTSLTGKIFDHQSFEVRYTLSLAKPLSYTRGTVIVCAITVECDDHDAIKRLGSPKGIILRLRRTVQHKALAQSADDDDEIQYSESAVWWHSEEGQGFVTKRSLVGELRLSDDLQPSSAMAHFAIKYSVVLFKCDDPAFAWPDTQPIITSPAQIVTTHADGAIIKAYADPRLYHVPND